MLMRLLIALAAASGLAAACSTLPSISDADVERARLTQPEATRASLERGKGLYVARCSACHEPWAPATRDVATWAREMVVMAPRARLDGNDRQLVLTYLEAFAERPAPEPPSRQ